eukprot:4208581-Prymnesium_polylepis.1
MLSSRLGDADRQLTRCIDQTVRRDGTRIRHPGRCQRCVTRRPCRWCDRHRASARAIPSAVRP